MIEAIAQKYRDGEKEITRLKRIIDKHEIKIEKIRDKSSWCGMILRPIRDAVIIKFPDISWDGERLIPLGLRNQVSFFGTYNTTIKGISGRVTIMLRFTPDSDGYVMLDVKPDYGVHGFGSKTERVKDIQQVFDYIQKQLDKNLVD